MYDRGIKVVLMPMIDSVGVEKFIPYEKYIDLVINFTKVGQEIYKKRWPGGGINGINISYPIDTEYFYPSKVIEAEYTFIHNEGFGGAGYRKSTDLVFTAFQQLSHTYKDITMLVNSQCGEQKYSQLRSVERVTIQRKDLSEAIDSYRNGQICVFPSRREGLGLPILEAMACGLPVITTDAPPMNEWFPEDYPLLVKVQCQTDLPYGDVPMYTPSAFDLMKKMEFAYNNSKLMGQIGETNRIIIQEKFSWTVLRDTYLEFLDR
jgi:glycosyltransferase involved in cell wall biosynthesis